MKIAILGAGAFGTALGGILAEKGYDIDYYDSKIERERLADVLSNAKMIVLVVPSKAVPYLLPHIPKDIPLIIATKGLLDKKPFEEFKDYMVLSGPGFAADIKAHQKTLLTATDERIVEMFTTDYLTFDFTNDAQGVLLCGALKNVYAILAGYQDLKVGTAEWEKFILEVADEMREILRVNQADPKTVDLSCGIGDLKLTCNNPSRNYEFGQILRQNLEAEPEKTVEGITALKKIQRGEIVVPDTCNKMYYLMELIHGN